MNTSDFPKECQNCPNFYKLLLMLIQERLELTEEQTKKLEKLFEAFNAKRH